MGYASDLYALTDWGEKRHMRDDQFHAFSAYLDLDFRTKHNMKFDWEADIFMTIHRTMGI
jgi:hypothetical protein